MPSSAVKVSVIVPAYNAERYIAACMESLLNQTLQHCEFIVVDDGSTDTTNAIVQGYMLMDERIKLIRQNNQGVSAARNTGLIAASGEYVGFVDADDYVKLDMYEQLYNTAKMYDCDVSMCNFESEIEGRWTSTNNLAPTDFVLEADYIQQYVLPELIKGDKQSQVVNKLYRRSRIEEHHIRFPVGVALGEDIAFNMKFLSFTKSMKYIDYSGYFYREVIGSATRNDRADYFQRALELYFYKLPDYYASLVSNHKVKQLKAVNLIHGVISFIHIYLKPSETFRFHKRLAYVRKMVAHKAVRESLPIYVSEMEGSINRYNKMIIFFISKKSILGLYIATAYSRFRNRTKQRVSI